MPSRSTMFRALLVILIFVVVGPLVGLVVFSVGMGGLAVLGGRPDGLWLSPFFMLYGLLFAHSAGLTWALVAGVAALVLEATERLKAGLIGPVSGIVSCAIATSTGAVWLPPDTQTTTFAEVADSFALGFAAVMLAVHVISASAGWWLARTLVRQRPRDV